MRKPDIALVCILCGADLGKAPKLRHLAGAWICSGLDEDACITKVINRRKEEAVGRGTTQPRTALARLRVYVETQRAWWADKWLPDGAAEEMKTMLDHSAEVLDGLLGGEACPTKSDTTER